MSRKNIDFISKRFYAIGISIIIIFAGLFTFISRGGFRYGIDFAGGTLVQLRFSDKVEVVKIRDILGTIGLADASIQSLSEAYGTTFSSDEDEPDLGVYNDIVIRTKSDEAKILNELSQMLNEQFENTLLVTQDRDNPNILIIQSSETIDYERLDSFAEGLGFEKSLALTDQQNVFNLDIEKKLGEVSKNIVDALRESLPEVDVDIVSIQMVGPQVGKDLRSQAFKAIIWVFIGILAYITWRFKFKFAVSSIVALLHDVLITLSMFMFFHKEINLNIIAAILTIIGYSLNDTIVVFDRIRENLKFNRKSTLMDILNNSINQTLARTLLTSLTTLMVVIILFLFGGDVIHNFAFALLIGIVVGTYSSIFIAAPVYYDWEETFSKKKKA